MKDPRSHNRQHGSSLVQLMVWVEIPAMCTRADLFAHLIDKRRLERGQNSTAAIQKRRVPIVLPVVWDFDGFERQDQESRTESAGHHSE
jgi:hypothetical protein